MTKSQATAFLGAPTALRSGEQVVFWVEYLNGNSKSYRFIAGTNELSVAMDRGEFDMHTTSLSLLLNRLMEIVRLYTSSANRMLASVPFAHTTAADFPNAPVSAT